MLSRRFGFGHRILSGAISRSFSTSAVFRSKKEYVLQYGAPLPAGLQAEVTAVCKPVPWSRFFPQQENMWTVDHSAIQTPGAQPTPLPASKWADIKPEEIRGMILFGHAKVTADTIKPFSNLKVVSNVGVGVDHIGRLERIERFLVFSILIDAVGMCVCRLSCRSECTEGTRYLGRSHSERAQRMCGRSRFCVDACICS